jgi:AraC-like DNA-binding protein
MAPVILSFEERLSDSPLVERVWRSWSDRGGAFVSVATTNLEIVISRLRGRSFVTLRGPETRPSLIDCPADGEWVAVRFRPGVRLRGLHAAAMLDRNIDLPLASSGRFSLHGEDWSPPDYDDAEALVGRLVRGGVLALDPIVDAAIAEDDPRVTPRSVQRRFLAATGLTCGRVRQIHRARQAALMLRGGASILDAAFACGYYDQAHLTRALGAFIGQTPARIVRAERQLSFLYKTAEGPAA